MLERPCVCAAVSQTELSSLNYEAMIGGPLNAVISAQASSAMATVDFIQSAGFLNGDAVMLQFMYNTTFAENGSLRQRAVDVPFLTLIPIPFIKVSQ